MLKESDVIKAVCCFLTSRGFTIKSTCGETETGDDIVAFGPNGRPEVTIEAKGETSSKAHTSRFGKSFSRSQVRDHVANAFFRAASAVGKHNLSGVALPKNTDHEFYVAKVCSALQCLGIEVFWVSADGSVEVAGHWEYWGKRRSTTARRS
jgi:hypothetical protein